MSKLVPKHQWGGYTWSPRLTGLLGPLAPRGRGGMPSNSVRNAVINGNPVENCAEASNFVMNKKGYKMAGHAWTRNGTTVYNGYEHVQKPKSYSRGSYNDFSWDAADDLKQNFDTTKLDKKQLYDVNMYVTDSSNAKTAFKENTNNRYGSHTGHLFHDGNKWKVFHNMHGDIFEEDLANMLGSKYNWGITGIFKGKK